MMNVLHISNDFPNSSLYKHLVLHIDQLNTNQVIYSAVRTKKESDFQPAELAKFDINIINILKLYDRILYRLKIHKIYLDLLNRVDISKIDIIHAHTLYSDGGVALHLKQKFGIPYIIAIRSTDINSFQKYRPDLRWRRDKILREAFKIIFTSPAHRSNYLSLLNDEVLRLIKKKVTTIPNGVDPSYLENPPVISKKRSPILKLLYVGTFIKRKKVHKLIEAAKTLNNTCTIKLTLVGGGGALENKVKEESKNCSFINYLGQITNREKLRKIYHNNDIFIMTSKAETFGLVYIEALSQGVPIIHAKDDAVDGYFEEGTVSETVINIDNPDEIAQKIIDLYNRYSTNLSKECVKQAQKFSWSKIADTYKNIYNSLYS